MRIAIVGTGISGLVCAHLLDPDHDVTVFEAADRVGGHSNTVDVELPGPGGITEHHAVDTGFIVLNDRNYPGFVRLLDRLDVGSRTSAMSFSVGSERRGIEYRGSNLNTLYAQRSNLLRPSFTRMLIDIVRFDRAARALLAGQTDLADDATDPEIDASISLEDFVAAGGYSRRFRDDFLIPFGASIWSADPATFLRFPAVAYCRFMDNHGLLQLRGMPTWRTVAGGSRDCTDPCAPAPPSPRSCAGSTRIGPSAGASRWRPTPGGRSCSTPWCSPGTPTRASSCSAIRPQPSARCWAPSGTNPTWQPCTPTTASCPAVPERGRAGTTTSEPVRAARRRSPTG
jgi:hypothetical protein